MRKTLLITLSALMMLSAASVAMAADGSAGPSTGFGLAILGMALGMGIAAFGCGLGQGNAVKAACEGIARNPDASGKISSTLILGLAFIESLAIYALLVDFILIFTKV